ncbi:hypothetical protein WN943_019825 [Citrus x changshan-huyou]
MGKIPEGTHPRGDFCHPYFLLRLPSSRRPEKEFMLRLVLPRHPYYELGPDDPPYAAKFYDCCGAEDADASGCTTGFHCKSSLAQLKWWSEDEFRGRDKKLNMLTQELQKAKQNKVQHKEAKAIKKIEEQIHNILLDEEIYWRHRARTDWLQAGDRNTKFFHSKATARKRKNKIWGVEDKNGVWTENGEAVEREFCNYF